MKIITVAHQKGGVGKTTLTLNLAACFAQGLSVGVLDTDVQGSLSGTSDTISPVSFIPYTSDLSSLTAQNFDLVVIDTPPYLTSDLPGLFDRSDFVLVPSKVGFYDVMAIRATIELLKAAQSKKPALGYGVVLNMVKPRTGLTESVRELLESFGVTPLETTIADRVSYTRSALTGGVFRGEDEKAQQEITRLADEILRSMGL